MVEGVQQPNIMPKKRGKQCWKYAFNLRSVQESGLPDTENDYLLPLKKVAIKTHIFAGMAMSEIELTYVNPSQHETFECTYEFPLEKNTVLSKLVAALDGRFVEAKIQAKEEAKEHYDDSIAAGRFAVMAQRKSIEQEKMSIQLGNLQPGQEATLNLQIVQQLKVQLGSYMFELPMAFFPDYSRYGVKKDDFIYDFSYEVRIQSSSRIKQLSIP